MFSDYKFQGSANLSFIHSSEKRLPFPSIIIFNFHSKASFLVLKFVFLGIKEL